MAAILQPFLISEEACRSSLSGSLIFSTYINLIRELFPTSYDLSQYSSTSSTPIWALFPTEKTLENASPLGRADSMIKTAVAPDPETKSHPSAERRGTGDVKTPLYRGVIMPIQFGPIRQALYCLTTSTISFSMRAPSSPSSLKPADTTINARVPLVDASSRITSTQYFA